jgi:6-phosphogluconolactonase (cycloisomerase 2 family)
MKSRAMRLARVSVVSLLMIVLAACGSGSGSMGGNPPVTPAPPPPPTPPASGSEFYYQTSFIADTMVSTLNSSTGALGPLIDAAPSQALEPIQALPPQVTPSGKFLYIQGFYQDPPLTGPTHGSPVNVIYGFSIDGPNGTLTSLPESPFYPDVLNLQVTPTGLVMDRLGKVLFYSFYAGATNAGPSSNSIFTLTIDPKTGNLTVASMFTTLTGYLLAQAVDPTNTYLYAYSVISTGPAISVFSIDANTGALTEIPGSPFSALSTNGDISYNLQILLSPSGNFIYAPITSDTYPSPGVVVFSVDATTGALTLVSGSPFSIGNLTSTAVLGASGKYLYAVQPENISVYDIDTNTGTIGPAPESMASVAAAFPVIDPNGQFLIVNQTGGTATSLAIDATTGALTQVSGSPFAVAPQPESVAIVKIP